MEASEINKIKKKHHAAIVELYRKHGVGKTTKQKLAFWESRHPHGYSISHNPTDKGKVVVFEACWCVEEFPADFIMC